MKIIRLLLFTFVCLYFSCKSDNLDIIQYNKDFLDLVDKKIDLVHNLKVYNGVTPNLSKKKILITGDSDCGNCIEKLDLWNQFLAKNTFEDTQVVFVLMGTDNQEFRHYIKNNKYANLSLLLDTTGTFMVANQIPTKYYQKSMILDDKNIVKLVGDPIDNEVILEYYHEIIKEN